MQHIFRTPHSALRILLCVWLCCAPAFAADEPMPARFMPSSEVEPGMVGEGYTVFNGFKVEPFKATILGVRRNALPGSNMIIAKLEGPMLAGHGVVAGMSGSPVYVNGRLIGAVAYGWSFAYEPVCGITPIESMWQVWRNIGNPALAKSGPRKSGPALDASAWDWETDWQKFQGILNGSTDSALSTPHSASENSAFSTPHSALEDPKYGRLQPLLTPIVVSGASSGAVRRIAPYFKSRGLELIDAGPLAAGGGGYDQAEPSPPIEPGSALAIPYIYGDINMAGVGTVTWRDGDKLIAFGHPMMSGGGVKTPMAAASIISFMESYERSFKLGDVRELIGTVDQDRTFAIGGKLGEAPPFIPITVTVGGAAAANPRAYRFKAWKDADFLPLLAMVAVSASWSNAVGGGELTISTDYNVRLADGRSIAKHSLTSAEGGDAISLPSMQMLFDLFALLNNPYEEADIASIEMNVDVKAGRRDQLGLISLTADRSRFLAGDTVRMKARIRPYRAPEQIRNYELALPKTLKPGSYVIQFADSGTAQSIERASRPGVFAPRQFEDIVSLVQATNFSPDQMRLYLFEPGSTMVLKGKPLGAIPSSMETLVRETAPPQLQQQAAGKRLDMQVITMDAPIQGSASLAIEVVSHFDE